MQDIKGRDSREFQPIVGPAEEKGWHRGVANMTSTFGIFLRSLAFTFVTSILHYREWSFDGFFTR